MLQPRKRISKKEIREDPLVTKYLRFQKFFQAHTKQINIGAAVVVAVLVIAILAVRSKNRAEFSAAGQLAVAEQFYYQGDYNRVVTEMPGIIDKYSGTRAAGEAAFFVANSYYEMQDFENSITFFKRCAKNLVSDPVYAPSSYAGIGQCLEMQGKYKEAAAMFEKAGADFTDVFSAPFYLQSAARCNMSAGDSEKAEQLLERVLDTYADYEFKQEVLFMLNSLREG